MPVLVVWGLLACGPEPAREPAGRPVVISPPRERLLGSRPLTDIQAQHLDAVAEALGVPTDEAARRGPEAWRAAGVDPTVVAGAWASVAYRAAARQVGATPPAEPSDGHQLSGLLGAARAPDLDLGGLRAYRAGDVEAWVGPGLVMRSDRMEDLPKMFSWLGGARTPFDADGVAWLAGHWLGTGEVVDGDDVTRLSASVPNVDVPGGQRTVETGDASYRFWFTGSGGTRPVVLAVPAAGPATLTVDAVLE